MVKDNSYKMLIPSQYYDSYCR